MCGIIGVISKNNREDLGFLIAEGLSQIQNRGDDSAGIAAIKKLPLSRREFEMYKRIAVEHVADDFNPMTIVRDKGRVRKVFKVKSDLESLAGFMGIGQVRYPTTGYINENKCESYQPLHLGNKKIAIVHNGDVHNYDKIMSGFHGLRRASTNDLEAILNIFAKEFFTTADFLKREDRITKSVKATMETIEGTYCVASVVNNYGIVVFRDSEGRRPLFYGVRTKGKEITDYAFASETVALEKMLFKGTSSKELNGRAMYEEVNPGEMIFISKDFEVFRKQIKEPETKFCPFEAVYFQRAASFVNDKRVKQIRKDIIKYMWDRFKTKSSKKYDSIFNDKEDYVIVPVPRTAECAAVELSSYAGIKYSTAIEKNPFSGRIFQQPTKEHREIGTISDHFIYEEEVRGKNIILIDDSIVRGTTMINDIKYLRDLGADTINVFITFPAIKHPCYHAIDFHTEQELLAHGNSIHKIKNILGLSSTDSLTYATQNELEKAIGTKYLCNQCYKV